MIMKKHFSPKWILGFLVIFIWISAASGQSPDFKENIYQVGKLKPTAEKKERKLKEREEELKEREMKEKEKELERRQKELEEKEREFEEREEKEREFEEKEAEG